MDRRRTIGGRVSLGADKAYDVTDFVDKLRDRRVTPHVAVQNHLTKTGFRGQRRVDALFTLVLVAFNLMGLSKLLEDSP